MSSVATNLVATMTNVNFSALKTTEPNPGSPTHDFSNVLKKVNSSDAGREMKHSGQTVGQSDSHSNKPVETIAKGADQAKDVSGLSEKVDDVTDNVESTITEMKGKTEEDSATAEAVLLEETLAMISELLGITTEALDAALEAVEWDILDLSDPMKLTSVIQQVFEMSSTAEILVDEQATAAFMEISKIIEGLEKQPQTEVSAVSEQQLPVLNGHNTNQVLDQEKSDNLGKDNAQVKVDGLGSDQESLLNVVNLRSHDSGKQETGAGPQEQTFGDFITNQLSKINEASVEMKTETDMQQVMVKEVINQIVTKAAVILQSDKTSMTMQLNPEHLGKVAVSVTAEQGVIKGQFVAENLQVKEMLEASMVQLKAQLEEQGIKVDKIEVALGSTNEFYEQQQDQRKQQEADKPTRGRLGRISRMLATDKPEEENSISHMMVNDESTVDYSA